MEAIQIMALFSANKEKEYYNIPKNNSDCYLKSEKEIPFFWVFATLRMLDASEFIASDLIISSKSKHREDINSLSRCR